MYEKFTDRAQKVMRLANQEAKRFNHEYIGTEHILLGLIGENTGVAANVLKDLGCDLRKVRIEVEKLMRSGLDPGTTGDLPQTPRAKRVIKYSMEEARNLNHNHVGTEHILLGLLREREGTAAQVLMNLGLKLHSIRQEVLFLLGLDANSVKKAMETTPLYKIEADLDHAEMVAKHAGDSVSADTPPEEPLADVLERVDDPLYDLVDAIEPLVENSADTQAEAVARITQMVQVVRLHERQQNETIKNQQETISVMRAEATKMRTESDAAIEGSLAKLLECVVDHVDLMMDPISTETVKFDAGISAKGLCRHIIHLAHLSALVDPQTQAMSAGLDATVRAMEPETPTDADKA